MEKPENSVGKSNVSRHFVGETSENAAFGFRRNNFSTLFSLANLDTLCSGSFSHHMKFYNFMFI